MQVGSLPKIIPTVWVRTLKKKEEKEMNYEMEERYKGIGKGSKTKTNEKNRGRV